MLSETIQGHPAAPLLDKDGNVASMITLCANCGEMKTIIFLVGNKWYCTKCRDEGDTDPRMFPVN